MTEEQVIWEAFLQAVKNDCIERISSRERIRHGKSTGRTRAQIQVSIDEAVHSDPLLQAIENGTAREESELLNEFAMLKPVLELTVPSGEIKTRKQLHHMVVQLEKYNTAEEQLKTIDIQKEFQECLETFVSHDAATLELYLRNEELCIYHDHGKHALETALSPQNSERFFSQFEREHFQEFLELFFFHRKLERQLLFQFARCMHLHPEALEISLPGKPRLMNEILPAASSMCDPYMDKMCRLFPMHRVIEIVSSRKKYRKAALQYEKYRSVRSALIRAIPAHYRDLYPLARTLHRNFILHIGPTNSGKTYDAVKRLEEAGNGVYLAPLRLLAYEQFDTINHDGVPCDLLTGEEEIHVVYSQITASTIEMMNLNRHYAVAVIDEAQMVADPERGGNWSSAILGILAEEIHLCASPDAEAVLTRMIEDCGDSIQVIHHERQTPLIIQKQEFQFPKDVQRGDALVVFSKRSVHAVAAELQKYSKGIQTSIIYGALPYDVRHEQARRFREGETSVVVATDAIGMGLNLPIRRIVFLEMSKFDGNETRDLKNSEIKQIAGRAGRYGIYDEGLVAATGGISILREAIEEEDRPIADAVIEFHESLLGIDAKLTDILRRWNDIEPQAGWNKADISRLLFLASMMEKSHTDKTFLYRMITIPFDEKDSILLDLWKEMYVNEEQGRHIDVLRELPDPVDPDSVTERDLDEMEHEYRICDLLANYARLFLNSREEIRNVIEERKGFLSKGIMKVLANRRLRGKSCKRCGRSMPWNYPFSVCEKCFRSERKTFSYR